MASPSSQPPPSSSAPTSSPDLEPKLSKTIGPWQILFYGLGSMLGAGIYGLLGEASKTLGNAVWLAFIAAMVAALLTGLSYACVGSRYARAGGAAYVTQRATRRGWLSYVVGLAVTMSGLTSMATGAQLISHNILNALGSGTAGWQVKLVAITLVTLVGLIIYRGMRESMWANIVCTVVEASGILFIIAVGVQYWGGVNYLETPGDTLAGGPGSGLTTLLILQGAVLTFFSFIGFEDILNVSEEVKNPRRSIPFGLIGAMITATLIYIAVAITAVSVVPWQELAAQPSGSALMRVAHQAAPWFTGIDKVYFFVTIFAIGNTALLNYIMGSRMLYGMSRQGLLPRFLGAVHPQRHTPHWAILTLLIVVAILILSGQVSQLAEATVMLLLAVFTVVNVSLVILKLRPGEPRGGFEPPLIVPILGALVCTLLIVVRVHAAITAGDSTKHVAPMIAGIIILISLGLYLVLRPTPASLEDEDTAPSE